jgi:hypothetical protein
MNNDDCQEIALFTFLPAIGATPNEKGQLAWAKVSGPYRGVSASSAAASAMVEASPNSSILHVKLGSVFPLLLTPDGRPTSGLPADMIDKIDMKKGSEASLNRQALLNMRAEQKTIGELEERTKQLAQEQSEKDDGPTMYAGLRSKEAQVAFQLMEIEKTIKHMCDVIKATRIEYTKITDDNPQDADGFEDRIYQRMKETGIDIEKSPITHFIRGMGVVDLEACPSWKAHINDA